MLVTQSFFIVELPYVLGVEEGKRLSVTLCSVVVGGKGQYVFYRICLSPSCKLFSLSNW